MSGSEGIEPVVDRVARLLWARIGLRMEPTVRGRLRRCVTDEAAGRGVGLDGYPDLLAAHRDAFDSLLNRMTVQETGFFRHPQHFEVLAREVLPNLVQPVGIWSAGCANGQEAFSIAMVLEEHGIDGRVIATDISTKALQRTAAARYTVRELSQLSTERRARHLTWTGHTWQMKDALRARVTAERHNLVDPLPDKVRSCQVVFCRNVLIYLSPAHARAFLDRLADAVGPVALFLGSAETLWPVSDRFEAVRVADTFVYRQRPAGKPPAAALARSSERSPVAGKEGAGVRRRARSRRQSRPSSGPPHHPGERRPSGSERDVTPAGPDVLASTGQQAMAAGDHHAAVVSFRKWAYLAPDDALAHLHLGLALEAFGDDPSARRAFRAARLAIDVNPPQVDDTIGGYSAAELVRLLDAKHGVPAT